MYQGSLLVLNPVACVITVYLYAPFLFYLHIYVSLSSLLESARHPPLLLVTAMRYHYAWLGFLRWTTDTYFNGQ